MTQHGFHGTCEACGHSLQVVNSKAVFSVTIQYVGCRQCGWRPLFNKRVQQPVKRSTETLVFLST